MLDLLLRKKTSGHILIRRGIHLSAFISFIILFVSCNNEGEATANNSDSPQMQRAMLADTVPLAADEPAEAKMISNRLYEYYIQNHDGKPDLKRLLGEGNEKLVFQFYRNEVGELGLVAWPGKQKDTEFDLAKRFALEKGVEVNDNLSRKYIHLGNLQLGRNTAAQLKKKINDPKCKFVFFVPFFKTISGPYGHVMYKIEGRSQKEKTNSLVVEKLGFANPSPPRGMDEDEPDSPAPEDN